MHTRFLKEGWFSYREKEDDLSRVLENQKHQSVQSEQALDDFKSQVERNSSKMYSDMKSQVSSPCDIYYGEILYVPKPCQREMYSLPKGHPWHFMVTV